jgi:hypothetical protein
MRAYLHLRLVQGQSGGYARNIKSPGSRDATQMPLICSPNSTGIVELRQMASRDAPIMQTMVSNQVLPRPTLPDGYPQLLANLKREIGAARTRAALAANEELIGLY